MKRDLKWYVFWLDADSFRVGHWSGPPHTQATLGHKYRLVIGPYPTKKDAIAAARQTPAITTWAGSDSNQAKSASTRNHARGQIHHFQRRLHVGPRFVVRGYLVNPKQPWCVFDRKRNGVISTHFTRAAARAEAWTRNSPEMELPSPRGR